jgi:hypothetical protein
MKLVIIFSNFQDVAALAERGRRGAPHFPSVDQAEHARSATAPSPNTVHLSTC